MDVKRLFKMGACALAIIVGGLAAAWFLYWVGETAEATYHMLQIRS